MDIKPSGEHGDPPKKRRKGATRLSCAECRRLKLRCDRSIPCSSCLKRGCGAICPDGSLTTGQGNRFVLASTQELHEKISELATRVRELEDGLRASHGQISAQSHPLLSEELLRIKAPLQREVSHRPQLAIKEEEPNPELVDAFGTLSISNTGRSKYFGHSANSWLFLQNELPEEEQDDHLMSLRSILPPEILVRAASFPISPLAQSESVGLQTLYWYLPAVEIAQELCNIYYTHAAWMHSPISKEAFETDVYAQFYNRLVGPIGEGALQSHRLSILFLVLAIGCLMNPSMPAYNLEAEKYHQLARAALFHQSIFDEPTIEAVQALYLMTYYLFLSDRQGMESSTRWATMGLAVKVAQSIGLHRDGGKWKVDPVETQRRRELFWELFSYDSWQSLTLGRPPSFALPHIDAKMPFLTNVTDDQAFFAWKHRFVSECMTAMHDQVFGARTPTYATILQLDRKLRAFPVPPILQVAGFGSTGETKPGGYPESVALTLQRHIVLAIRESNLLYLHRSFFARAISDHPKDPLGSPYGTSVIAAYRSAGSLVAMMRNLHGQLKEPSERIWFLWTHMFSCSIILGSIVTRCPSMSLAPSALVQLDSAYELFSRAARGFRATKVLEIMRHLRERAHHSLDEFRRGKAPATLGRHTNISADGTVSVEDGPEDDELTVLGGKTRLVSNKEAGAMSPGLVAGSIVSSPTSLNPVVPLPLSPDSRGQLPPDVLDYLATFGTVGGRGQHHQHPSQHLNHHQQQQQQQQQQQARANRGSFGDSATRGSFSESDLSPVSIWGTGPGGATGGYHADPSGSASSSSSFNGSQQQASGMPSLHNLPSQGPVVSVAHGLANRGSGVFPSYFPVYDYAPAGPSSSSGSVNGSGGGGFGGLMLEVSPIPPHRRISGSPDTASVTMHSTWQDFVDGMAMQS